MPSVHSYSHSAILYNASLLNACCRNAALYLQCRPFLIFLFWFSFKLFMTHIKEWISQLSGNCWAVLLLHFPVWEKQTAAAFPLSRSSSKLVRSWSILWRQLLKISKLRFIIVLMYNLYRWRKPNYFIILNKIFVCCSNLLKFGNCPVAFSPQGSTWVWTSPIKYYSNIWTARTFGLLSVHIVLARTLKRTDTWTARTFGLRGHLCNSRLWFQLF